MGYIDLKAQNPNNRIPSKACFGAARFYPSGVSLQKFLRQDSECFFLGKTSPESNVVLLHL